MAKQTLRQRLDNGDVVVGTFQIIDSAMVAEMVGVAGMDFVILDQEHGPLTADSSLAMCAAAAQGGADSIVRVRENSEAEVQRALDIGASGVEIPQIETRADAEAAVDHARFAPLGERGLSQYVRAGDYAGHDEYPGSQNETVCLVVHIEGKTGVENIEEILTVEGIDVFFLGPYDLSQSLGIPGEVRDDRVEREMERVCDAAARLDKTVGTFADDVEMARQWIDAGVQYVALSVDAAVLTDSLNALTTDLRDSPALESD